MSKQYHCLELAQSHDIKQPGPTAGPRIITMISVITIELTCVENFRTCPEIICCPKICSNVGDDLFVAVASGINFQFLMARYKIKLDHTDIKNRIRQFKLQHDELPFDG